MKKILLLVSTFSALCANLNAQNSNIKVGIKNMSMIDNEKNTLEKPITIPNSKAASTINVGTSDNVFSILGDRQNQDVYKAMKKILLLVSTFSALCANLNAQNSNIKVGIKNMSMIDNEKNTLEKPITIPNSKAASTINVGTSDNVFSILGDRQNQVVY